MFDTPWKVSRQVDPVRQLFAFQRAAPTYILWLHIDKTASLSHFINVKLSDFPVGREISV